MDLGEVLGVKVLRDPSRIVKLSALGDTEGRSLGQYTMLDIQKLVIDVLEVGKFLNTVIETIDAS